ncbi:MAG: hypothetical protein GY757_61005, partial [bacterium]|nr:hypothetical protein [bacterium]
MKNPLFIPDNSRMVPASLSFFLILLLLFFRPALAQDSHIPETENRTVILNENIDKYPLGPSLEYLEDKDGKFTVSDVASVPLSRQFLPNQKEALNFGITDSAYWVRFSVRSPDQKPPEKEWFLEFAYPPVDYVELWIPVLEGNFMVKKAGDSLLFEHREIKHRNYIFRIKTKPDRNQTLYLHVKTESSMQ